MAVGFDVISDLNVTPDRGLSWEGKATNLYCIAAGNISSDLPTLKNTLTHLSKFYQGVFFVAGNLEYEKTNNVPNRTAEISRICDQLRNVIFLHNNVVIINNVAIMGSNGWYGIQPDSVSDALIETLRYEDLSYLGKAIERLQLHVDVKKIIVVTSTVPGRELYFGEEDTNLNYHLPLRLCLLSDSEHKVTNWIYGGYKKEVDITLNNVNFISNGFGRTPYWAKRVTV